MTERLFIPESKKYLPIIKDIIQSMKDYGESFSLIKTWHERVRVTFSDNDYPYCMVVIRRGSGDSHNIPRGIIESVDIDIIFEVKSYNDGKTQLIYDLIEDAICMVTSGSVVFNQSKYYSVKELKFIDWEYTPNTDGSFIFDTARVSLNAKLIICKKCKEVDTND